ncbi:sulfur oxidation c-type cytochrome SoxX [Rhodovarius sp.]|uniref:sulfur oxidation c-type cytochrome SoxX n=1 Tax=Rhodovarius sp. TaxID=2972673 RepID=UPI003341702C
MPSLKPLALLLALAGPALAEGLAEPLTAMEGDAGRGRAIIADRSRGLCLLCHSGPFPEERFQGNLAPSLAGVGARMSASELRLRLVDSRRVNPESIMPAYHRAEGLHRVAPALRGRMLLQAQEIEDVLAFLLTLREESP